MEKALLDRVSFRRFALRARRFDAGRDEAVPMDKA
jgi:hypothetical protein